MSETKKRGPLGATDKRRQYAHRHPKIVQEDNENSNGGSSPLARLFSDRRGKLGHGKRAS